MPLVIEFLNGFNTGLICYGQTGSGKTYSMFGEHEKNYKINIKGESKDSLIPEAL